MLEKSGRRDTGEGKEEEEGVNEGEFECVRRGLKPSSAHGRRAQTK